MLRSLFKTEDSKVKERFIYRHDISLDEPLAFSYTGYLVLNILYAVESTLNDLIKEYVGISPLRNQALQAYFKFWGDTL